MPSNNKKKKFINIYNNIHNNIYVCSIDLQKALLFSILIVSDAYYKRNMYCYNFIYILFMSYMKIKNTFMFGMKH